VVVVMLCKLIGLHVTDQEWDLALCPGTHAGRSDAAAHSLTARKCGSQEVAILLTELVLKEK
jgi:hypothetical protein